MTTRPPARPAPSGWPVLERSILGSVLGLPGYAAILIAFGFTGLGVFIDLNRINGLGGIFKGCYFAGCVLAVCWVKRRALFGPMVQPPLLLAIAVPGVVYLTSGGNKAAPIGLADRLLSIGAPLLNGFPTMAGATAFTVAIGVARYLLQRAAPSDHQTPRSRRGVPDTRSGQPRSRAPRSGQPRSGAPRSDQPRSRQPRSDQPRSDQPRSGQRRSGSARSATDRSGSGSTPRTRRAPRPESGSTEMVDPGDRSYPGGRTHSERHDPGWGRTEHRSARSAGRPERRSSSRQR